MLNDSNDRVSDDDLVKVGSIVSGVVDRITSNAVVVCVNARGFSWGKISVGHLADHHGINSSLLDYGFPLLLPLIRIAECGCLLCRASYFVEVCLETRI